MIISLPIPQNKTVKYRYYYIPHDMNESPVRSMILLKKEHSMMDMRKQIAEHQGVDPFSFLLAIVEDNQIKRMLCKNKKINFKQWFLYLKNWIMQGKLRHTVIRTHFMNLSHISPCNAFWETSFLRNFKNEPSHTPHFWFDTLILLFVLKIKEKCLSRSLTEKWTSCTTFWGSMRIIVTKCDGLKGDCQGWQNDSQKCKMTWQTVVDGFYRQLLSLTSH